MKNTRKASYRLLAIALLVCLLLGCCMPAMADNMDELIDEACWNAYTLEYPDSTCYVVGQTYSFKVVADKSLKKTAKGWSGSIGNFPYTMITPQLRLVDGDTVLDDAQNIPNVDYNISMVDDGFLIAITVKKAGFYEFSMKPQFLVGTNATDAYYPGGYRIEMDVIDKGSLLTIETENTGVKNTVYSEVYEDLGNDELGYIDRKGGFPKGKDIKFIIYTNTNFAVINVVVTDKNGKALYSQKAAGKTATVDDIYHEFTIRNVQSDLKLTVESVPYVYQYGGMLQPFYGDAKAYYYDEYGFTDEYPLYDDMTPSDWYFEPVFQLWQAGIIDWSLNFSEFFPAAADQGDSERDSFYPQMKQPRGLTAYLLFNSIEYLNLPFTSVAANPFSDVKLGAPYYYAVLWAADNEVVTGFPGGTFKPDSSITREQMCAILLRLAGKAGLELPAVNEAISFKDSGSISSWAASAVKACQTAGVVGGYPDGTFKPKNTISNAEACMMIYRFLSLIPE